MLAWVLAHAARLSAATSWSQANRVFESHLVFELPTVWATKPPNVCNSHRSLSEALELSRVVKDDRNRSLISGGFGIG